MFLVGQSQVVLVLRFYLLQIPVKAFYGLRKSITIAYKCFDQIVYYLVVSACGPLEAKYHPASHWDTHRQGRAGVILGAETLATLLPKKLFFSPDPTLTVFLILS